jgi:CRP/FNR family cyclic AMP-dependent transcriptional regulator
MGSENLMNDLLLNCQSLPEEEFESGRTILGEGEKSGLIYILIEGEVEILKRDITITRVSEPGSILGEISALLDIPHMATVKAIVPCRFYVVEDQADFLRNKTEICYPLAVMLARRLHSVTNYLADIKEQFKDHEDHFGMMDEILDTLVNQQGEDSQPGSDRDDYPF